MSDFMFKLNTLKLPAPYNLNSKRHEMSLKFNPCSNAFKSILKIFLLWILLLILYIKSTIEVLKRYSWFDIPIISISFFFKDYIFSYNLLLRENVLFNIYLNLPEIKTKYFTRYTEYTPIYKYTVYMYLVQPNLFDLLKQFSLY